MHSSWFPEKGLWSAVWTRLSQGAFHVGRRLARRWTRLLRAVGRLHDRLRSTLGRFDAFSTANRKRTSPENALQENSRDLRLFARSPRDRGAHDLPHLRAAQARVVLKGQRP